MNTWRHRALRFVARMLAVEIIFREPIQPLVDIDLTVGAHKYGQWQSIPFTKADKS